VKRSRLEFAKLFSASMLILAACSGPSGGGADDDDDDDTPAVDAAVDTAGCANPVPEVCGNTIDDDCDGIADCDDADCSDACNNANCGQAQIGGTLALPDNDCSEDLSVPCPGYENPINITGFNPGQTLTSGNGILGICLNIEHSWMRDIIIYAQCPNGTRVMMSQFEGRNGGEVFLGQPNDDDEFGAPVPGVGYDYCWVPGAANLPWIPYANANPAPCRRVTTRRRSRGTPSWAARSTASGSSASRTAGRSTTASSSTGRSSSTRTWSRTARTGRGDARLISAPGAWRARVVVTTGRVSGTRGVRVLIPAPGA
jgi:hypothetical protein